MLFTVLLGADLAANDTVRIGCASALIATLSSVAAGIVARVATDRWIGVFEYVYGSPGGCWLLARAAVPALLASVTGLSNVGIVWLFIPPAPSTGAAWGLIGAIALMPVTILGGVCLGILPPGSVCTCRIRTRARMFCLLFCRSAGVIVPVSTYPAWLAWVCSWFPGSRLVQALDTSGIDEQHRTGSLRAPGSTRHWQYSTPLSDWG